MDFDLIESPVYLTNRFKLLFGVPNNAQADNSIASSIAIGGLTLLWIVLTPTDVSGVYYLVAAFALIFHASVTIKNCNNLLFLFRYFLIWILIFGTAATWGLTQGEILVAPFGPNYQTHKATAVIVGSGILALCGSSIGWNLALKNSSVWTLYDYRQYLNIYSRRLIKHGVIISYFFALLYAIKAGGVITSQNLYADEGKGIALAFNVNNIFIFFGIGLCLLGQTIGQSSVRRIITVVGGSLIICILTGSRGDYLPQLIILVVGIGLSEKTTSQFGTKNSGKTASYWRNAVVILLIGFIGFYLSHFIGVWRSSGSLLLAGEDLFQGGDTSSTKFLVDRGHDMLNLETGNQILGTFYAVVANLQLGYRDYLFGGSYFDYLLRTPPDFLGIPRPQDLAWDMYIDGFAMAQGGVFELAEAYFNFGFLGVIFVPMAISYFFGALLRRAVTSGYACPFYATFFVAFGLHAPRSVWYQTFSYYRLVTVYVVIYLMAGIIAKSFVRKRT